MPACFVIMPFGQTSPKHTEEYWRNHFDRFIKPAIDRATVNNELLGYKAIIVRGERGQIPTNVFNHLQSADVVLADLTDANPNVLYELGIRHTMGGHTILIIEKDPNQRIPFYFQNYNVITYSRDSIDDFAEFQNEIEQRLAEILHVSGNAAETDHIDRQAGTPLGADNPVDSFFQVTQKRAMILTENETNTIGDMRDCQVHTLYTATPRNNDLRNERKNRAIANCQQSVKLLAHSGHSFLAPIGARFKDALMSRVADETTEAQILLLNPWTDTGLLIALGEITPDRRISPEQEVVFEKLQQGKLKGIDPVSLIEKSISRRKLLNSIEGYLADFESAAFAHHIQLRFCEYEIVATMLLTDRCGFFEPYIHVNLPERQRKLMHTFELEFSSTSYLWRHAHDYFDRLWTLSVPYDEFIKHEDTWKTALRQKYG